MLGDLSSGVITEPSLTAERYASDLEILALADDPILSAQQAGDFWMIVGGAQRSKRAYELLLRFQDEGTDAARQEFCDWLRTHGYEPE